MKSARPCPEAMHHLTFAVASLLAPSVTYGAQSAQLPAQDPAGKTALAVTITEDVSLSCDDNLYTGRDVIVVGATLTLDCDHDFRSLELRDGAVLTHTPQQYQGFRLSVSNNLVVDATSRVDVAGLGYPASEGPGAGGLASSGTGSGASHGGSGGASSTSAPTGPTYGSILAPSQPGSGGGLASGDFGGGVALLTVGQTAHIDGIVDASAANTGLAGGSGGSIFFEAQSLEGAGLIRASGSAGSNSAGHGGGGGGRVHISVNQLAFEGEIQASGWDGWTDGGAGTIYFDGGAFPQPLLVLDNADWAGAGTDLTGPLEIAADVVIRRGARLAAPAGTALDVSVDGNLLIEADGKVGMNGRGFPANEGPGAGSPPTLAIGSASGGSHGGTGGQSSSGFRAGATYGDFRSPATLGSGGGGSSTGGEGGGAAHLVVTGTLTVDGLIEADGIGGRGGGAGGSIWLEAGALAGSGAIQARGGNGTNSSGDGAGAGGRIAVTYTQTTFGGALLAHGGDGWRDGGPGTIFVSDLTQGTETLIYDNLNRPSGMTTQLAGTVVVPGDLVIRQGANVGPSSGSPAHIVIEGSLLVQPTGALDGVGHGHGPNSGPGAGGYPGFGRGSGGAHGGTGAQSSTGAPSTAPYGTFENPTTMGSGGGYLSGGQGGGALRLTVLQDAVIDGQVRINGASGGTNSGGGAGGSFWLTCNRLSGSGLIQARGGSASASQGAGGGGGGRVEISCEENAFLGQFEVCGGSGWQTGSSGTLLLTESSSGRRELIIDNCNLATNWTTDLVEPLALQGDLLVRNQGKLGARIEQQCSIAVDGDIVLGPSGRITVKGRGLPANSGPGAGGLSGIGTGSGGGFGGTGGNSSSGALGGAPYGSSLTPSSFGSGGGYINGGRGGGSLYITATGALQIDGIIDASGDSGGTSSGGGSGGSIYIISDSLQGNGAILADGGSASSSQGGGGGGGGRIAIYTRCDPEFDVGVLRTNGGTGWSAGSEGSVFLGYTPPSSGDIILTSSSPGTGKTLSPGTLIQEIFALNNGPPPFDGSWTPLVRQSDLHSSTSYRCSPFGIITVGDDAEEVDTSGIASLQLGAYESSFAIRVFNESSKTTSGPISVNAVEPGLYNELSDLTLELVPAGTSVQTHLLHFDSQSQATAFLAAEVTFDAAILGVQVLPQQLDSGDTDFAIPGIPYPTGTTRRGLDFSDATDAFEILPDRRTIRLNARVEQWLDQVRVITEVPDPLTSSYVSSIAYLDAVDEVSIDGCSSGFYRFTFNLPAGAQNVTLDGITNVSPQGVVYLNGTLISGQMTAPQCEPDLSLGPTQGCYEQVDANTDRNGTNGLRVLTTPTVDCFNAFDAGLFLEGTNELVFGVASSAAYWQPTGLEFLAVINFD